MGRSREGQGAGARASFFSRRLAVSRMPLIRFSSRLPDVLMVAMFFFTRSVMGPQLPVSMMSDRPMMPFSGVRSSCDVAERNRSWCHRMAVGRGGVTRRAVLQAAAPTAPTTRGG